MIVKGTYEMRVYDSVEVETFPDNSAWEFIAASQNFAFVRVVVIPSLGVCPTTCLGSFRLDCFKPSECVMIF